MSVLQVTYSIHSSVLQVTYVRIAGNIFHSYVCIAGNICRSPLAETAMNFVLKEKSDQNQVSCNVCNLFIQCLSHVVVMSTFLSDHSPVGHR